ncbi:hypothetical protein SprV_0301072600 [Sparganum proliferum]
MDIASLTETRFFEQGQQEENLHRTPSHPDQHLLPSPDVREGHLDETSFASVAHAGLFPRPEARPAGRPGDKGDPGCRGVDRPSLRRLQDEDSPTASQEAISNELSQRQTDLPVATDAADEDASVENRWRLLSYTVQR